MSGRVDRRVTARAWPGRAPQAAAPTASSGVRSTSTMSAAHCSKARAGAPYGSARSSPSGPTGTSRGAPAAAATRARPARRRRRAGRRVDARGEPAELAEGEGTAGGARHQRHDGGAVLPRGDRAPGRPCSTISAVSSRARKAADAAGRARAAPACRGRTAPSASPRGPRCRRCARATRSASAPSRVASAAATQRSAIGERQMLPVQTKSSVESAVTGSWASSRSGTTSRSSLDGDRARPHQPRRGPVKSTIVDGTGSAHGAAVEVDRDRSRRAGPRASAAVVAGGWPLTLALDTASGPVARSSSRATGCSGIRTATVPRSRRGPRPATAVCRSTRVSPPGQNASTSVARGRRTVRRPARRGSARRRPAPAPACRGRGPWRPAARRPPPGENASAAMP